MSERLTQRTELGTAVFNNVDIGNIAKKLCDLEDKIEQGKILELPCNVGQWVYVPWQWGGQEGIASTIVECIQIVRDAKLCGFFIDMKSDDTAFNDVYGFWRTFADIGKKIFLTREEAEKALAERSENGKS